MKLRRTVVPLVAAIGLTAAVSVTFARQDSPQHKVLFEKAKFTMETKGDLQGAIGLFEEIIRKYPNEREYAAQALLQIGPCYEKLGVEGARGAYQRLIKEYPGQTAAVTMARQRLDNLLRAASLAKKAEGDITIRKVLTPKGFLMAGAVSPDGRYLADIGELGSSTRELRITEIATGKERFLRTENPDCSGRSNAPQWSPDSTKLVVATVGGLCVVPLDGSAARILVGTPPDKTLFFPLDWSPDQKHILVSTYGTEKPLGLSLVAVADGSHRPLKIGDSPAPGRLTAASPGGLTVACDRGMTSNIFLLWVDGSREIARSTCADDAARVAAGRAGHPVRERPRRLIDVWSLRIENGQPRGAPRWSGGTSVPRRR
jgi:hypothetical protein